ncbi:zinc metalloproteinase nas-15-like [Macrosteles quadrilineatus]|uniref:zinc metalloproteinase nas-15-like n=1 Tax=Macrosteles quadrilineatus TaxID=74068 RepID=UPI0023E28196|nr:zinc metalloproteinase nas-15-like [Macrosteles quadrilineatus]
MYTSLLIALSVLSVLLVSAESKTKPPPPQYVGPTGKQAPAAAMAQAFSSWSSKSRVNIWELSGQYEGDIMMEGDGEGRNAVQDKAKLWPGAVVPYYIDTDDFDKEDRKIIRGAVKNIESETCIQFRPYKDGDDAYVVVRGDRDGCWSYVGRKDGGQTLNLSEKCVRHGVAVHEFLHALGLHHQQSSHDRDDYVTIHWDNIESDHKHNFDKYNSSTVTDHGVGYDYESIMHYSAYAFSRNDQMTITPKDKKAKIGQRKTLSDKDIAKLNTMYNCPKIAKKDEEDDSNEMNSIVDYLG